MQSNLALTLILGVSLASVIATVTIATGAKRNKFLKYLPPIVVGVLAILYCIAMTIFQYSGYIGIVYMVVLIIVSPAVLISLLAAVSFDIWFWLSKKRKKKL